LTTKLTVKRRGITGGVPLLVLHGWGMNSSAWQAVATAFEKKFHVIWVDLPGHGDNHQVDANNLSEIVALISPLITQPTHIMGWSLGGLIAQGVIQQQPELIRSVVMVASTPRFSQSGRWHHAMPDEVLSTFSENLISDIKGTIKRFIALQFMQVKNSQVIQRNLREHILGNIANKHALNVGLQILQQQDFLDIKIEQQQLWLLGGKDRLIPIKMKNDLALLHPHAIIEEITEAGHAPFMTHPQQFVDIVIPFLMAKKPSQQVI